MPAGHGARRGLLIALFAVYVALLAWLVLWKFEVPWTGGGGLRSIKLVPFASTGDTGASSLREVIANVAFFVPFGLYLGMLAPRWGWWRIGLVVAAASLAFEALQFALAIGSSDITDVVTNTAGGLIGLVLFRLARRALPKRAVPVLTTWCIVLTVIGVLATAIFIISPLRYAPMDRAASVEPLSSPAQA